MMAVPALKLDGATALLDGYAAPTGEADWAKSARERAAARLRAKGAPVRRDEYWRYTDPAKLTAFPPPVAAVLKSDEPPVFDDVDRLCIVFVDGVFSRTFPTNRRSPASRSSRWPKLCGPTSIGRATSSACSKAVDRTRSTARWPR